jgi:pimeloyl-ACP methyl ester carboxylesterase
MNKFFIACFSFIFNFSLLLGTSGQVLRVNSMDIWYETFGQRQNPAFLLIMGSGGQGILWPTEFCEQLAERGFYVIRYDLRDAGYSSCLDYTASPYDLLDMTKDAVDLLDVLKIEKAHLFGLSMGGSIAELMAVHFPTRVSSIALWGACFDFRPYINALDGMPVNKELLSPPRENYFKRIQEISQMPLDTSEQQVEQRMQIWGLLNGSIFPLEDLSTREMHRYFLERSLHPENLQNYGLAMRRSEEMIKIVHHSVKVPTVIFHGSEDPIFGHDHAAAIAKAITGSVYYYIEGLGHLPNSHFFSFLIDKLEQQTFLLNSI